jgi:metal-sulfur cluster biosynthetic enzyme
MNSSTHSQPTEGAVLEALRDCHDPEIPVDIVSLGLIYGVTIVDDWVGVKMTLTSPGCPASSMIAEQVKTRLRSLPGVSDADVRIVWHPEWTPARMSKEAKKKLGRGRVEGKSEGRMESVGKLPVDGRGDCGDGAGS